MSDLKKIYLARVRNLEKIIIFAIMRPARRKGRLRPFSGGPSIESAAVKHGCILAGRKMVML